MKKLILMLLLCAGCTTWNNGISEIRIEGVGIRADPALNLMEVGYFNGTVLHAPLKAGQGGLVRLDQYGLTSSNLLSSQTFMVMPYFDCTLTAEDTRTALFTFLGFSIPNPCGANMTRIRVAPAPSN